MARRIRNFVRPAPRTMVWAGNVLGSNAISASSSVLVATLNAAALALRPFTIVWTRMDVHYSSDQESAAEAPFGALGCIVVKDSASNIGVTAVPTPLTETDSDWYVWQVMAAKIGFVTGVGFSEMGVRYTIDSKAMRKVGIDDDAVVVF